MLIILICWDFFEIWKYWVWYFFLSSTENSRYVHVFAGLLVPQARRNLLLQSQNLKRGNKELQGKYCSLSDPSFERVSFLIYWPVGLALWMKQPWRRLTKKDKELLWSNVNLKMLKEKLEQKGSIFCNFYFWRMLNHTY